MKVEERYEGDFLEAIDLPEGAIAKVVIESIVDPGVEYDAAKKLINKAILVFRDKKKRFILNKTNYRLLKILCGPDPTKWIGQEICLQRRYLDAAHAFGFANEMCIRVIPPTGTPMPKSVRDYMGSREPSGRPPKGEAA